MEKSDVTNRDYDVTNRNYDVTNRDYDVTNRDYDVFKRGFVMAYAIFVMDNNLVDSFIETMKAPKPCFKETFHKIENDQDLKDVIFSTKKNKDSTKYVKIINPKGINILALQVFVAMAEFNRMCIFLNEIPPGLEIRDYTYKVSDKMFENSSVLENTEFYIKRI